uniref:E4 protein n=1 Tax=Human papillomavirus TaxID=10566 RepID=A0A385PL16_9PAPI|nr:MAG: E4 protein [Human papillomavirus]
MPLKKDHILLMFILITILIIHFLILTGMHCMCKMKMTCGIKHLEKWILMVYILKTIMVTKHTLLSLLLMRKDMVLLENGLYIIKMKLCLLLLLVHKQHSPDLFKGLQKDLSRVPGTPHPARKTPDDVKLKRESLARPPRRHLTYDVDEDEEENKEENKENQEPKDDERRRAFLGLLLDRLAEDILQYQEQVLHDLADLRQKLGIRHSSL